MPDVSLSFLATLAGAVVAFAAATIAARSQQSVAKLSADKDLTLQRERQRDERFKTELGAEREHLLALHRTLSQISFENSQTTSFMQSDANMPIAEFRSRYLENCGRLHDAMAIAAVHYPAMLDELEKIDGEANIFWGYQENVLRTDFKLNPELGRINLAKVLDAGRAIALSVASLKALIAERGRVLARAVVDGGESARRAA